jgi:hypothetical protein
MVVLQQTCKCCLESGGRRAPLPVEKERNVRVLMRSYIGLARLDVEQKIRKGSPKKDFRACFETGTGTETVSLFALPLPCP